MPATLKTLQELADELGGAAPAETITADETAAEVRGLIVKILSLPKVGLVEKNSRIADAVTRCLQSRGQFYYHAELRDFASAMFFDKTEKTLMPIHSDRFRSWLAIWTATNRADPTYKYITAEVDTVALSSESSPIIPEKYWAGRDDAIYLSCGDGLLMKITAKEVRMADNGTDDVLFPCGSTLTPWEIVAPVDPFESCAIFRDLACVAPHGKDLLRVFMTALPANFKCKPPLAVCGDIGSGKTRACKAISEIYGIPERITKVDETKELDFWVGMDRGGLLILDNADTKVKWLPDAVSTAATDGSKENRKLYTDGDVLNLRPRSWLAITSAVPTFASDAGLADRLIVIRMKRRQGATADNELSDEIRANRDSALSFIAQTLSKALADKTGTPKELNARHPDFGSLAVRIGRAIGRETEVITALQSAESDKARFCLENDTVGAALLAAIPLEPFHGTAAQLLARLKPLDPDMDKMTTKRLSNKLRSHWPHIEGVFHANKQVAHGGALEYELSAK